MARANFPQRFARIFSSASFQMDQETAGKALQVSEKSQPCSSKDSEAAATQHDSKVEDSMATGSVDPTLELDEAENARLRRKIHWQ